MPKGSSGSSEADMIFSRASLALATSQRLIASWMPPKPSDELVNAKTEEELAKEEEEDFKVVPETLGLGATAPADGNPLNTLKGSLTANDKLKKQLFGKNWNKIGAPKDVKRPGGPGMTNRFSNDGGNALKSGGHAAPKARPSVTNSQGHGARDSSDEEGGRSSLGKSKKRKLSSGTPDTAVGTGKDQRVEDDLRKNGLDEVSGDESRETPKRRGVSYLDQVLSERSKKKKNKKRKKSAEKT